MSTYKSKFIKRNSVVFGSILIAMSWATTVYYLINKVKRLEKIAKYDYLTGARDIGFLDEETRQYRKKGYGLIFIDMNKFKEINDTYGHSVGDEILRELGVRLRNQLDDNLIFRYGGDEFIIFIKDEHTAKIDEYIKRINTRVFTEIVDASGRIHKVTGSVGAIGREVTKSSISVATKIADCLMYRAKEEDEVIVLYAKTDAEVEKILNG